MLEGAVGIIFLAVSVVLCAGCAEYWHRYRSLHLVPFALGALFEVLIRIKEDDIAHFDGTSTLIVGCILYGLTWLNIWSSSEQEKLRKELEAARLPKLPPWVQHDIDRTLQRAAPSRFFNVRTELPDESETLLITADVPNDASETDIAVAGQLICSIVESRVSQFKRECTWVAMLRQNGHPVYSVRPE